MKKYQHIKQILTDMSYLTSADLHSVCSDYRIHSNAYPTRQDSFRLALRAEDYDGKSSISMCYYNIASDIYMHGFPYTGHDKFFDVSLRLKARQQ